MEREVLENDTLSSSWRSNEGAAFILLGQLCNVGTWHVFARHAISAGLILPDQI